jgi:hypothetical protein
MLLFGCGDDTSGQTPKTFKCAQLRTRPNSKSEATAHWYIRGDGRSQGAPPGGNSGSAIGLPHLQAALAVWDYCYTSAALLFGMSTGDPIADRIREAIESADPGSSKHQIRRLFHGHLEAHRIDTALEKLLTLGAISTRTEPTGGRPSSLWSVMPRDQHEDWTHRQRKTKSRRKMNRWTSSAYGSFGALFLKPSYAPNTSPESPGSSPFQFFSNRAEPGFL